MKTYFYERTAYKLSEQPVPQYFITLDDFFDFNLVVDQPGSTPVPVLLAESICSRLADVEMFAFLIEDTRKRHRLDKDGETRIAILTRSFLVGYLGAARALLDSCATALSILYQLPLKPGERTFANPEFWQYFVGRVPNVQRRYHPMRLFFNEVMRWCNETADRIPPIQVLHNQFGMYPARDSHLRVADDPNADLAVMDAELLRLNWINALDLHLRWKPNLSMLCEKVCVDIQSSLK